jgi:hypothetical protein
MPFSWGENTVYFQVRRTERAGESEEPPVQEALEAEG